MPAHDIAQEPSSRQRSDNAQFVLEPHVTVEQTPAPQPLDALPATILQLLVIAALVLIAEQQDVEVGAEQSTTYSVQVLRVIVLHLPFKLFAHVQHGCSA